MIIKPEISVIFPIEGICQNTLNCLQTSIDSILFQSFYDLELVLVDDQHCPSSTKICQEYIHQDPRIKYIECIHSLKPLLNIITMELHSARVNFYALCRKRMNGMRMLLQNSTIA